MIDYGLTYTAEWRLYEVDPSTWADGRRIARIASAKVERMSDGLMQSGSMEATSDGAGFEAGYRRLVLVAEQGGAVERDEIATMLCSSTGIEHADGFATVEIEGRSVLYPASVRKLLAGTYAPKGADGAAFAAGLLRESIAAPVIVEGSFILGEHIVFNVGTSYLDAARMVLDAGGFCIRLDGHGTVHVCALPTEPALVLDGAGARLLMPERSSKLDYSDIPNVYRADDGALTATAINDDPSSVTSTVSRGYEHDYIDRSPKPLAGETLAAYALRRLRELSVAKDTRSYEREHAPGVLPNDIVRCSIGDWRGDYRVTKQSIEIGEGISVSETAVMEVSTWPEG